MNEPTTITSAQAPDIEDVRQWLQQMIKAMRFMELVVAVVALITRMRELNTDLTRRLADLRRKRPSSETLARIERQMVMVFAFGMMAAVSDVQPENKDEKATAGRPPKKPRKGIHPGRAALPDHLERVPEVNRVPATMRSCPVCGATMKTVGHSTCEILDVRPAELYVRQRLDERVACPHDDVIVSTPTRRRMWLSGASWARH